MYFTREFDYLLDELQAFSPATSIDGPRGAGKTATAARRAATILGLDDPYQREFVETIPGYLEGLDGPVLVDEWQRVPRVWDMIRREVGAGSEPGRYLLTGSAAPVDAPVHSGAGRFITFRLRPMGWTERGYAPGTVSLRALLEGGADVAGMTDVGLDDYAREVIASGFPGIRRAAETLRPQLLNAYVQQLVDHDLTRFGVGVRRPATLRAWLRAYAAATATTTAYDKIRNAATVGEGDKPATETTIAYRDALERLWLLDPLPAWEPTVNPLRTLTLGPKHFLADPALVCTLLGLKRADLVTETGKGVVAPKVGSLMGALFEALVVLSVRALATRGQWSVSHLRTRAGRQAVDLLVHDASGSIVGIEAKLSRRVQDADVQHLLWLRDNVPGVRDVVVVTTGDRAYRRRDGVVVCPLALLGF